MITENCYLQLELSNKVVECKYSDKGSQFRPILIILSSIQLNSTDNNTRAHKNTREDNIMGLSLSGFIVLLQCRCAALALTVVPKKANASQDQSAMEYKIHNIQHEVYVLTLKALN